MRKLGRFRRKIGLPSLPRSAGSRRPFLVGWGDPGNKLSCNHFGVAATPLSLESTKLVLFLLPPSKVGENRSFGLLPFVAKLYSLLCLSALSPPLPLSACAALSLARLPFNCEGVQSWSTTDPNRRNSTHQKSPFTPPRIEYSIPSITHSLKSCLHQNRIGAERSAMRRAEHLPMETSAVHCSGKGLDGREGGRPSKSHWEMEWRWRDGSFQNMAAIQRTLLWYEMNSQVRERRTRRRQMLSLRAAARRMQ